MRWPGVVLIFLAVSALRGKAAAESMLGTGPQLLPTSNIATARDDFDASIAAGTLALPLSVAAASTARRSLTQAFGPSYVCVPAHDYSGTDLRHVSPTDSANCRRTCSSLIDCTFYIFNNQGDCWLKSDFANGPNGLNQGSEGIVEACIKLPLGNQPSYSPCYQARGYGGTLLMPAFPASTEAFCVAVCSHRSDCVAYEHSKDQRCSLKTGMNAAWKANNAVSKACRKKDVKLPVCAPGDGLFNGVCRACDAYRFSAGGSMAQCQLCSPDKRPMTTLKGCTKSAMPNCKPGSGIKQGACKPCGSQQYSPGGAGVVCTSCPPRQVPNQARAGCIAASGASNGGFKCVAHQDYAGTDIGWQKLGSLEDCKAACAANPECLFSVYSQEQDCWLKKDLMNGPNGQSGPASHLVAACFKDAAGQALCPRHWSYSNGLCCDSSFDAQGNCQNGGFVCSVDRSIFSTALDCSQVKAACPADSVPYNFGRGGGLCCGPEADVTLGGPGGSPSDCSAPVGVMTNDNFDGEKYAPEANCPEGWTYFDARHGGFCCQDGGAVADGGSCKSSGSCAVDGNMQPNGKPYCSSVTVFRVVFLNLQWCSSGRALTELDKLTEVLYDSPNSLQNYYPSASGGRVFFDRSTSTVVDVDLPCDQFPMDQCDYNKWMDHIQQNSAALGINDYDAFPVKVSIAPGTDACGSIHSGIAGFASGNGVFLHSWAATDMSVVKHELGHVQGLGHASWVDPKRNKFEEYGDLTSPMGISCGACLFAAPELFRLGWARPPSERFIFWSTVKAGTKMTFQLKPLADDSRGAMLAVVTTIDPSGNIIENNGSMTVDVFLSYRVTKGQDSGLEDKFSLATSVHSDGRFGKHNGQIIAAWLKTGQAFIDHFNQLVAYQVAGDDSGAQIVLCRYKNVPRDCGSNFVDYAADSAQASQGVAAAVAAGMAVRFPQGNNIGDDEVHSSSSSIGHGSSGTNVRYAAGP